MRSMRQLIFPVLVLLLALAMIAGCGGGDEEEAASVPGEVPVVVQGGSPILTPTISPLPTGSPLPTPGSPLATPGSSGLVGVAGVDTGAVTGRILVAREAGDIPIAGIIVGLAEVLVGEDGVARASGYSPDTPNRITTDDSGGFAINNVPPGIYSIILDAVVTSYQLADPESGNTILVEVQAGSVEDIGVLRFDSLPLPGFSASE